MNCYYLRGHAILPSLIDATFAQAARFHALPMERKLAVTVNEDNVGYLPMKVGQFPGPPPRSNAAFFLRRDRGPDDALVLAKRRFHGLNQWPAELPGFRETALAYMRAMARPVLDRERPGRVVRASGALIPPWTSCSC